MLSSCTRTHTTTGICAARYRVITCVSKLQRFWRIETAAALCAVCLHMKNRYYFVYSLVVQRGRCRYIQVPWSQQASQTKVNGNGPMHEALLALLVSYLVGSTSLYVRVHRWHNKKKKINSKRKKTTNRKRKTSRKTAKNEEKEKRKF